MRPALLCPALLCFAPLLAACAAFPALDTRMTAADRAAPIPALVPLGPLLAAADARGAQQQPPADLAGRVAALAARAAALRGPVLDAATADRIAARVR